MDSGDRPGSFLGLPLPECDDKWTDNSKGHSDLGSGLRVLVIPPKPAEVLTV